MKLPRVFALSFAFLVFLVAAAPASAQPRLSVGAGYQAVHLPDTWAAAGFNLDVAFERSDAWSVLGEFGIAHDGDDATELEPHDFNLFNVGGGVRWTHRGVAVMPFVQLIAGVQVSDSDTDTDTAFMLQPGAGLVVPLSDRLAVTGQIDYRPVFYRENLVNEFRIVAGIRYSAR